MANESTSLRGFLDQIEARLDVTEPLEVEDSWSVASLGPAKGGLVGLGTEISRVGAREQAP
jgi:hypothetical protein